MHNFIIYWWRIRMAYQDHSIIFEWKHRLIENILCQYIEAIAGSRKSMTAFLRMPSWSFTKYLIVYGWQEKVTIFTDDWWMRQLSVSTRFGERKFINNEDKLSIKKRIDALLHAFELHFLINCIVLVQLQILDRISDIHYKLHLFITKFVPQSPELGSLLNPHFILAIW